MSYVDLKHLLADLTLDAVRNPAEAGWVAVAAAWAEAATEEHPIVGRTECLRRAGSLAASQGWAPGEGDLRRLITAGLLSARGGRIALPDRFQPHFAYLRRHPPRLLAALAALRASGRGAGSDEIRLGVALFNAGLFFECHEWFEGLWKASADERKEFYHGIVQAAAAFYHYEKRNMHGCRTLLRKGRRRLASYPARFAGVDLARLTEDLARWAGHFDGGPRPDEAPRIRLLRAPRGEKTKGAPRG